MNLRDFDLTLYLVTDVALCGERGVVETVRQAVEGGVTRVQVRAKPCHRRRTRQRLSHAARADE